MIHFPKGEGIKIIKAESEAKVNDTIYILPLDERSATMIIRSRSGQMRKIGIAQAEDSAKVDLFDTQGNVTSEGNVYLKGQVEKLLSAHTTDHANPHQVTKEQVGLGNVDNTSDKDKPISDAVEEALRIERSTRYDEDDRVRIEFQEADNLIREDFQAADSTLSATISEINTLVGTINSWKSQMTTPDEDAIVNTVTELVELFKSVPEGQDIGALINAKVSITSIVDNLTSVLTNVPLSANQGKVLKGLIDTLGNTVSAHTSNKENPHAVTKAQVGLGNADNTSDLNKPVSTAQQEALDKKLDKTTTTISAPDSVNKYVYLTTEDNAAPKRMLAGDLGKNIANSLLTSVNGAGFNLGAPYTWNTAGYPFKLTGLADKSADASFNKVLVEDVNGQVALGSIDGLFPGKISSLANKTGITHNRLVWDDTTKTIGYSEKPEISTTYNFPSEIMFNSGGLNNINFVLPPNPSQDVLDTIERIKNLDSLPLVKFKQSEIIIKKLDKQYYPASIRDTYTLPDLNAGETRDGYLSNPEVSFPAAFRDFEYVKLNTEKNNCLYNIFFNKELPVDKDWVIKCTGYRFGIPLMLSISGLQGFALVDEIGGNDTYIPKYADAFIYAATGPGYAVITGRISFSPGYFSDYNGNIYIVKVGNLITLMFQNYNTGSVSSVSFQLKSTDKYLMLFIQNNKNDLQQFIGKNYSYYIYT